MHTKREANLANQPTLVPLYGGLDKRPRPLDRDVITVGRARSCDIGLEAPEVSTLHCLLYRTAEGFRVRDCGSRTGTRVNGDVPRHNVLADGDVLQIGPFSFTVQIPPAFRTETKVDPRLEQSRRSRRNLAHLALNLRRRLHRAKAGGGEAGQADLGCKATELRNRIRQYDQRLSQLERAERDLEADREQLRRERDDHLAHVQEVEGELAQRLEAAEKEIHARWQEFQQRCLHEERERLRSVEDLERKREEIMNIQEKCAAGESETSAALEKQRTALAQAEAALREQRAELGRMMNDLREFQAAVKKQQGIDVQVLSEENEELRRMLGEYERRLAEAVGQQPPDRDQQAPDVSKETDSVKGENDLLRQLLREKDSVVQELKQQLEALSGQAPVHAAPLAENVDLESFEAELNRYRQQLESDRAKLNQEIEQLRLRNVELDEATRETEMEMSKERAELARERTRLDRLRDEVRSELERIQRDATVRESLAPVQKLREEMSQKKAGGKEDGRVNDRLRSFRNRLTDSPS
jgi:pSer/pThr/pTyr-binding forkhead associated (FHA) protein